MAVYFRAVYAFSPLPLSESFGQVVSGSLVAVKAFATVGVLDVDNGVKTRPLYEDISVAVHSSTT